MRIEVVDKKTRFYVQKKNEDKLKKVLKHFKQFDEMYIIWSKEGFFYVNKQIRADTVAKIKQKLNDMTKRPKTVKGYRGCPITMADFAWII